jgi:nucleotide-binding universal stress UspA family protein
LHSVNVNATVLMAQSDPVKTVLNEAERLDAELIVVGSHVHGGPNYRSDPVDQVNTSDLCK